MAVNTCEVWSSGIKIAFFSKNLQNRGLKWLGGIKMALPPDPHSHRRLGDPPPDPRL